MKILLSNKYYYPRGGGDIYMIELEKLLKEYGHEVANFSMQHPMNLRSEFTKYFPREVDLDQKEIISLLPSIIRPFGSKEVRDNFTRLLENFKPDIVHLNNIHSQISPVLTVLAQNHNIPVVWTLHDHKLLCPRYDCMRDNKPCELCFYSKHNVVRYRCMKNSFAASLMAYIEAIVWNKKRIGKSTNIFICPSMFLLKNMTKGGFNSEQLIPMSNFINDKKVGGATVGKKGYYCYVGRLSKEKGIETLLKAAAGLPQYILKVIGTGPLELALKAKYKRDNIEFMGFRNWDDLKIVLESSQCMVIPSECYENNPLSVVEALCLGTPVIGAEIGGIPELINPGRNGLTFETGNVIDLQNKIIQLFQDSGNYNYVKIANEAKAKFNSENYYQQVIKIYNQLIDS